MSKNNKNNAEVMETRNFVAREMGNKFKSKRFNNDRGNRRGKDSRNSWKNQMWN